MAEFLCELLIGMLGALPDFAIYLCAGDQSGLNRRNSFRRSPAHLDFTP